jgi:hypothetical protein
LTQLLVGSSCHFDYFCYFCYSRKKLFVSNLAFPCTICNIHLSQLCNFHSNLSLAGGCGKSFVIFEILTAGEDLDVFFYVLTLCVLVSRYQRYGGLYCFYLQGRATKRAFPPPGSKRRGQSVTLRTSLVDRHHQPAVYLGCHNLLIMAWIHLTTPR